MQKLEERLTRRRALGEVVKDVFWAEGGWRQVGMQIYVQERKSTGTGTFRGNYVRVTLVIIQTHLADNYLNKNDN